jgi:hypothetical protein
MQACDDTCICGQHALQCQSHAHEKGTVGQLNSIHNSHSRVVRVPFAPRAMLAIRPGILSAALCHAFSAPTMATFFVPAPVAARLLRAPGDVHTYSSISALAGHHVKSSKHSMRPPGFAMHVSTALKTLSMLACRLCTTRVKVCMHARPAHHPGLCDPAAAALCGGLRVLLLSLQACRDQHAFLGPRPGLQ